MPTYVRDNGVWRDVGGGGGTQGIQGIQGVRGVQGTTGPVASGYLNCIINGGMEVDQRYNGSSVSLNNAAGYIVDRWVCSASGTGAATAQRVVDAPVGFINSLKYTTTTTTLPSIGQLYYISQSIEGYNIINFAYGTASPKTVTLSFWVKSSLSGTFGGSLRNQTATPAFRSYIFNYTINSANTWEYKTVTATGDTGQVPALDTSSGFTVFFNLGSDTTYVNTTLNSWISGNYVGSNFDTRIIGTLGATFQVTGVQLEVNNTASSFERPPASLVTNMCQRYFYAINQSQTYQWYGDFAGRGLPIWMTFPSPMRAAPTTTSTYSGGVNTSGAGTIATTVNTFYAYIGTAAAGGAQVTLNIGTFYAEL
jgi:hypothetical protein